MGLLDKITRKEQTPTSTSKISKEDLSLNVEETKILLHLIKNSNFKGDSVELVYDLTKKLQSVLTVLS
jgi:hypothetical protein